MPPPLSRPTAKSGLPAYVRPCWSCYFRPAPSSPAGFTRLHQASSGFIWLRLAWSGHKLAPARPPNARRLQHLSLEGNRIDDEVALVLLESAVSAACLKSLNLSVNNLTDACGEAIKLLLGKTLSLEQIYLHWNRLKGIGGQCIFSGLLLNETVRVCDVSNNQLALDIEGECVASICDLLRASRNACLLHLDLSRNGFSEPQSQLIAAALLSNHTLIGLHFQGNQGVIDPLGFLVFPQLVSRQVYVNQRIEGVEKSGITYKGDDLSVVDNCWICEGWEQHTFEYVSDLPEKQKVFLHVDFLEYRPLRMREYKPEQIRTLHQFAHKYRALLMCPPKRCVFYFFSLPALQLQDVDTKKQMKDITGEISQLPTAFDYGAADGGVWVVPHQQLRYLNCFTTRSYQIIEPCLYVAFTQCRPRMTYAQAKHERGKVERQESGEVSWDVSQSIWRYCRQAEEIPQNAAEAELDQSHLKQMVTDEQDFKKVKLIIRAIYPQLKLLFRMHSVYESASNAFLIFHREFSYLIAKTSIVDNKFLKVSEVDTVFSLVKAQNTDAPRGLTLPMFFECLVKLAEIKYIIPGFLQKHCFALKELLDGENFIALLKQAQHPIKWRKIYLWKQNIEQIVRYYWPFVQILFNHYSTDAGGKRSKQPREPQPGAKLTAAGNARQSAAGPAPVYKFNRQLTENKQWLLMQNFHEIFQNLELDMREIFLEHELNFVFSLSVDNLFLTRSDAGEEGEAEGQYKLSIIGFFEALARLSSIQEFGTHEFSVFLPDKQHLKYKELTLGEKLENMLIILFRFLPIDDIAGSNECYESVILELFARKGLDANQRYQVLLQQPSRKFKPDSKQDAAFHEPFTPHQDSNVFRRQGSQRKSMVASNRESEFAGRAGNKRATNQITMIHQQKKSIFQEAGNLNQFMINSYKQKIRDIENKYSSGSEIAFSEYEKHLELIDPHRKDGTPKHLPIEDNEMDQILENISPSQRTSSSNSSGFMFKF